MKKAILMLFVLGFVGMNGYAQKVYKKDNKFYLECTVASGMPAGSVTTTSKCVAGTKVSNTTFRDGSTTTNPYAIENDKVFEKLEIDASDLNNIEMDWVTAYNGCKAKNTGGVTGWRLPTQRELMLMYIFRVQLAMTGFGYWSSSEATNVNSWFVSHDARTESIPKTNNKNTRCVREVK